MAPSGEESRAHRIVREAMRAELKEREGDVEGTNSSVEISTKGLKVSGHDVNLIVTVLSAIGIALLLWVGWTHQQDAREASAAFVGAIKEQISAQREQTAVMREANCLTSYQGPPDQKGPFCRQVTR